MEANLKLKTRLSRLSEDTKHWLRNRMRCGESGWKIESKRPEDSEHKARRGVWSGFLSLGASQGPRFISQVPLTTLGGERQKGRGGSF